MTGRRINRSDYEDEYEPDLNHEYEYIDDIRRCRYCKHKLEKVIRREEIHGHFVSIDEYYCPICG